MYGVEWYSASNASHQAANRINTCREWFLALSGAASATSTVTVQMCRKVRLSQSRRFESGLGYYERSNRQVEEAKGEYQKSTKVGWLPR
jgi:hypothetical protein